ncbi:hypothetical protein [Desulfopila sp. IMCC35008]|uniref:hypothetical protein n=1 Tax=Desulfopila sp. IMCC35008 TaxID=2653858 RepID=UPI0013D6CBC6|nr:hypothetical protein [Desulfopila sp. IMCC35008]
MNRTNEQSASSAPVPVDLDSSDPAIMSPGHFIPVMQSISGQPPSRSTCWM